MDYTIDQSAIEDVEFDLDTIDVSIGNAGFSVEVADLELDVIEVSVVLDLERIVEVAANDRDDLRALAVAVQAACNHAELDVPGDLFGQGLEELSAALGLPEGAEPRRVLAYATRVVSAVKGLLYVFSTPG